MALSGSIVKNVGSYWRLSLEWSATQSIANNRSTVTAKMYWESTHSSASVYSSATKTAAIRYNSGSWDRKSAAGMAALSGKQKKLIHQKTFTINHKADGTASFTLEGYFDAQVTLSGVYYGRISLDAKTFTLDTIPRASDFSVSSSGRIFGQTITINISRASSSFTHRVRYKFGSKSGTIATGVGTSTSWTIPKSLMSEIPNSTTGSMTIYVDTFSGSTQIGSKSRSFTVYVPDDVRPNLKDFYFTDDNGEIANKIGEFVQNKSKLRVEVWSSHIEHAYGSSIVNYKVEFNNQTKYGWRTYFDITKSGSQSIKVTITDGRGRSHSLTKNINVLSYQHPQITSFTVKRGNQDGSDNNVGNYAIVRCAGKWSTLNNKNKLEIKIDSKPRDGGYWENKYRLEATTGSFDNVVILGTYSELQSYDLRLTITDSLGNVATSHITLPTAAVPMSWSKTGVGIGKVWERGVLDIGGDVFSEGEYYGGFGATRIPQGADLNDYKKTGWYFNSLNDEAQFIKNNPTNFAFAMQVVHAATILQILYPYDASAIYIRAYHDWSDTWRSWKKFQPV